MTGKKLGNGRRAGLDRPVVITGATGFIGANLCRHFLSAGYKVVGVKGSSTPPWRLLADPRLELTEVDLRSQRAVSQLVRHSQPCAFIHCAAYGAYDSQNDVQLIYEVNLQALRYILESLRAARQLRCFIQAGTSSEYGFNCAGPSEDAITIPDSHYAVSKLAATALVRFYAAKYRLPAWCLRLYSVYGPLEDGSRLIPRLLIEAIQGRLPALVQPNISRDFVFIDDVVQAFDQVVLKANDLKPGEIYNIGTGTCTTLRSLVALSKRLFRLSTKPRWGSMPSRHWDHRTWYSEPRKAREELGWTAKTALDAGLRTTMQWMRKNPELLKLMRENTVIASQSAASAGDQPVPLSAARPALLQRRLSR